MTLTRYYTRLTAGPAGSHAVSGSWKWTRTEGSDDVDVSSFRIADGMVTRRDSMGSGYVARIGGPVAPYTGDPRWNQVQVNMPDPNTLEETYSQDGALRMKARWHVEADGVTAHARFEDPQGHWFEQSGHKVK